jgi:hypothetical protein
MTIKDIRNNKSLRNKFITYFKEELDIYGDYLIGKVSDDFILTVFEKQGYWAGVRYNYSFNEELEMLEVEQRRFAIKEIKTIEILKGE